MTEVTIPVVFKDVGRDDWAFLEDTTLSIEARGLLAILLHKFHDRLFDFEDVMSSDDRRRGLPPLLKELINAEYVLRCEVDGCCGVNFTRLFARRRRSKSFHRGDGNHPHELQDGDMPKNLCQSHECHNYDCELCQGGAFKCL